VDAAATLQVFEKNGNNFQGRVHAGIRALRLPLLGLLVDVILSHRVAFQFLCHPWKAVLGGCWM